METQAALSKIQADAILASHTLSCGKYRHCGTTGNICLEYETLLTDKERRAIQEFLSRIFEQTKKPRQLYESAPGQNQKVKGEYQMNEIIAIQKSTIGTEVKQTVNARDLHAFLGVGKDFTNWIKDQISRARLVENRDFVVFAQKGVNPSGGRPTAEYHLTLDAGKHVSMMSNTDKGFEVRDYFIECERIVKDPVALLNDPATLKSLLLANLQTVEEQKLQLEQRDKLISVVAPKAAALEKITIADGEMCLSNAGKVLGWQKLKDFFQWLHNINWTFRRGGDWIAHQDKQRAGLMVSKVVKYESSDGRENVKEQALITPKGLTKLAEMMCKQGVTA